MTGGTVQNGSRAPVAVDVREPIARGGRGRGRPTWRRAGPTWADELWRSSFPRWGPQWPCQAFFFIFIFFKIVFYKPVMVGV